MSKIISAEEFCKTFKPTGKTWKENFHQTMIEFTKLHVEAQAKIILEKSKKWKDASNGYSYQPITKEIIVNSYPETNIT